MGPDDEDGVAVEDGEEEVHQDDAGRQHRGQPRPDQVLRDEEVLRVEERAEGVLDPRVARLRTVGDLQETEDEVDGQHDAEQEAERGHHVPVAEVVKLLLDEGVEEDALHEQAQHAHDQDQEQDVA